MSGPSEYRCLNSSDPFGLTPCAPVCPVPGPVGVVGSAVGLVSLLLSAEDREALASSLGSVLSRFAEGIRSRKPEIHHIATDKNRRSTATGGPWTPVFEPLFEQAGVSMNSIANKVLVFGHKGPHPQQYHQAVFDRLVQATRGKEGEDYRRAFIDALNSLALEIATPGTALNSWVTKR